jgi:hypothetical protein
MHNVWGCSILNFAVNLGDRTEPLNLEEQSRIHQSDRGMTRSISVQLPGAMRLRQKKAFAAGKIMHNTT